MKTKVLIGEYAGMIDDAAVYAQYCIDCDKAEADALFDALHGGKAKRPTKDETRKARLALKRETGKEPTCDEVERRVMQDRANANKPPVPNVEMGKCLSLAIAMKEGNNADPFDKEWERLIDTLDMDGGLPDRVRDAIGRRHGEFVAAFSSGDWLAVKESAESLSACLRAAASAAGKSRGRLTNDERDELLAQAAADAKAVRRDTDRRRNNARRTGRKNQRNGEKNGNGRKTDPKEKNQLMTEVRQMMSKGNTQANACRLVSESKRHLKADGKTPLVNKRTLENWMSEAKRRSKPKRP